MRIKNLVATACLTAFTAVAFHAAALSAKDIALAQKVIAQVVKMSQRYDDIELVAPDPLPDASGKYLSPYSQDGEPTEWAEKALTAEAGATAGSMAGESVANKVASKVPFGGLMRKKTKEKATSAGAAMALGGWDTIREGSDTSFNKMDEMAVYLHVNHRDDPGFDENLAAAMHLYPELKKGYRKSIDKAYRAAKKAQKRKK